MSHVARIELQIRDLDALAKACAALGLELVRDQKSYHWYGESVGDYPLPEGMTKEDLGKCDHAIRLTQASIEARKGAYAYGRPYEIGVVRRQDGKGFNLLWDFYHGGYGLEQFVGKDAGKLRQEYSAQVATSMYRRQGFMVSRTTDKQGRILLSATR